MRYGGAELFAEECGMKSEDMNKPVIVCRNDEEIHLSDEELSELALGPKFCVFNNLNEETFDREVEECVIKFRWEMKNVEVEEVKKVFWSGRL